jgi:hypothetical protein
MRLRFILPIINLAVLLLCGIISWPWPELSLDRLVIKLINPILFWNSTEFVAVMLRLKESMGRPVDQLSGFVDFASKIYFLMVLLIGVIQWYLIGILFERIRAALKAKHSIATR